MLVPHFDFSTLNIFTDASIDVSILTFDKTFKNVI